MQKTIHEGMRVRTAEGEVLGTVVGCGDDGFLVEKGRHTSPDFVIRYEEVAEVRDDEVRLGHERSARLPRTESGREEGPREVPTPEVPFGEPHEVVLELAAEEVVPEKVVREVGQLRITKVVRTEMRHLEVPVRREEVHIERVAAPQDSGEPVEGAALRPFEGETLVIPLYEEHVEVTKHARVWQEVRVSKTVEEETRELRTAVRREVARVEERGDVSHEGSTDGYHS